MRTSIALITGALVLAGCASSRSNQQPTTAQAEATEPTATTQLDTAGPGSVQGQGMAGGMHGGTHDGTMQKEDIPGGGMAGTCPMAVEGTMVRAEQTDSGMAIVFTTTDDVAKLRQRVGRMAEMYNQHQTGGRCCMMRMMQMHGSSGDGSRGSAMHAGAKPGAQEGMMGGGKHGPGGGMMGGGAMMMPPSTARVQDIDGGSRLVLTPSDPSQLTTLQKHAEQMAQHMGSGKCPIMESAGQQSEPLQASPEGDSR